MNAVAKLTKRESEIAELFAWGAAKKDVAGRLFISEHTVENHSRAIYEKVGCGKVNELSAWWFCTRFNISFDLSPLKRTIVTSIIFLAFVHSNIIGTKEYERYYRRNTRNERIVRTFRRHENEFDYLLTA
jgi:DNA-binding CsgD family transcriptional regulator